MTRTLRSATATGPLVASAFVLAGILAAQLSGAFARQPDRPAPPLLPAAQAGMVTEAGDYILLTTNRGDNAELLLALDRKTGVLLVYDVVNNRTLTLLGAFNAAELIEQGRPPTRRRR